MTRSIAALAKSVSDEFQVPEFKFQTVVDSRSLSSDVERR